MTLHEAILQILRTEKPILHSDAIAEKINEFLLYRKADGTPVTAAQILLRAKNYPKIFAINEDNFISLKINQTEVLSYFYKDLSDILRRKGINNSIETLKFLFYLRIRKNGSRHYLGYIMSVRRDQPNSFVLQELEDLNVQSEINGVFDTLIKALKDSEIFEMAELINFIHKVDFSENGFYSEFFNNFFLDEVAKVFGRIKRYLSLPDYASNYIYGLIPKGSIYFPMGELEAFKWVYGDEMRHIFDRRTIFESSDNEILDFAKILKVLNTNASDIIIQKSSGFESLDYAQRSETCFSIIPAGRKIKGSTYLRFLDSRFPNVSYESFIVDSIAHNIMIGKFGFAYLVVPEGFLFSSKRVDVDLRESLIKANILSAVISLPEKLFYPASGLKTSLIVLTKKSSYNTEGVYFMDATGLTEDNIDSLLEKTDKILREEIINDSFFIFGNTDLISANSYTLSVKTYFRFKNPELSNLIFSEDFVALSSVVDHYFKGRHVPNTEITNNSAGIPLIRVNNLTEEAGGLRIDFDSIEKYVNNSYALLNQRFFIRQNSILLATHGMTLKATLFDKTEAALVNTNIICVEPDPNKILPEYLLIQLKERYFEDQVEQIRNTNLIPYITTGDLLQLRIKKLSLAEQEKEVSAYKSRVLTQIGGVIRAKEESSREGELKIFRSFKHELGNRSSELNNYLQTLQLFLEKKAIDQSFIIMDEKIGGLENSPTIDRLFENIYNVQNKISASFRAVQNVFDFQAGTSHKVSLNLIDLILEVTKNYTRRVKNLDFHVLHTNTLGEYIIDIDRNQFSVLIENFIKNVEMHGMGETDKPVNIVFAFEYIKESNRILIHIANDGKKLPEGFSIDDFVSFGFKSGATGNTGIGGYLTKLIIDNHKGKLKLGKLSDWILLTHSRNLKGEKNIESSFEPIVYFIIELNL